MKKNLPNLGKGKFSQQIVLFPIVLILLASLSYYAPSQSEQVKLISTYPATVCPAVGNKIPAVASLNNSKIQRRLINGISKTLNAGKNSLIALNNDALLVEGNPGTALTFVNSSQNQRRLLFQLPKTYYRFFQLFYQKYHRLLLYYLRL